MTDKQRVVARFLIKRAVLWSDWMKDQPKVTKKLFHGSSEQGLTKLDSEHARYHSDEKPLIFGSDDKGYAAGFTFPWTDDEGIAFGFIEGEDFFTLEVPKSKEHLLYDSPCSIYTIEGTFQKAQEFLPEWASIDPVEILDEEQFENPMAALEAAGNVKVVIK